MRLSVVYRLDHRNMLLHYLRYKGELMKDMIPVSWLKSLYDELHEVGEKITEKKEKMVCAEVCSCIQAIISLWENKKDDE